MNANHSVKISKGRLQNRKSAKLWTLFQQEGGSSEGLPKCPNPYFEPKIQHKFFESSTVVHHQPHHHLPSPL